MYLEYMYIYHSIEHTDGRVLDNKYFVSSSLPRSAGELAHVLERKWRVLHRKLPLSY